MRASFLTFSQTGNTLKVAHAIGEGLATGGVEVSHHSFLRRRRWAPQDSDLIAIGCPVFENRPAEVVLKFLAEAGPRLEGKRAIVYQTSGGSPARSLWRLSRAVASTGAQVLGGIQLRGSVTFPTLAGLFPGRPDALDLGQARELGEAAALSLTREAPLDPRWQLDPRSGGRFYDWFGPVMRACKKLMIPRPTWDADRCDLCAACVKECPSDAARIRRGTVRFGAQCIRCYRCWQICPTQAIQMRHSPGRGIFERLVYSEGMERRFGNLQPGERQGDNHYRDLLARRLRLRYDPEAPTDELVPAAEIRPRGRGRRPTREP